MRPDPRAARGRADPLPTIGCRPLDTAEKPRHFVERPLGRRQANALRRTFAQRGEAFDRHGEVRAALGRDERVNLVDDDGVDGAQRVACVRGQEQVQRFRRRDQDVGRGALKPRALGRWRIAGTDRDGRDVYGSPRSSATRAMPASGARRLRSTSTASAFKGET